MRHFLEIRPRSAKLACGPAVAAFFPMESKALDPSGVGKIDVALRQENVTCERCNRALALSSQDKNSDRVVDKINGGEQ